MSISSNLVQSRQSIRGTSPKDRFGGLHPVFADSLPDHWGNTIFRKWAEAHKISMKNVTGVDLLSFIGKRAMGALEYAPQRGPRRDAFLAIRMKNIVEQSRHVLDRKLEKISGPDALREIFKVGTSAGGAQAKAVVGWNPKTDKFCVPSDEMPEGFEHWIIKITPDERPYLGVAEYRTYELAKMCGVEMSESRLYEIDGVQHFMTRRFDREGQRRHHLQTFRAMRSLPPDVSLEMNSYGQLFETLVALNLGYDALSQMFRRMVFNVYSDETDDHSKNFSFMMREGGAWGLSPAYDLTGGVPSEAPEGDARRDWTNCHAMSINGKQSNITDDDLLEMGARYSIGTAESILAEIKDIFANR